VAVLVGFLGVLIVTRPSGEAAQLALGGVAIALVAALGTAGVVITLRQLRHTEHVAAIVFWFFVASAAVGAALLPFFGSAHDANTILLLAAAGVAGGLMQITLTASLQKAPVSVLSPLDYLQIVGTVALGWVLLAEVPTVNTLIGSALIVTSGLYIAWREHKVRRARSSVQINS
jgi:drug/metabolite transporter (DMT)-like permease